MPKKGGARAKRSRKRGNGAKMSAFGNNAPARIIKQGFRHVTFLSNPSSSGFQAVAIPVHPQGGALGDVMAQTASCHDWFRVVAMRVRLISPYTDGVSTAFTMGLAYNQIDTLSSGVGGFDTMAQFPSFAMGNLANLPTLKMGRAELCGEQPYKWFQTSTTGAPPAQADTQGLIHFGVYNDDAPSSSLRIWVEMTGEIEFCGPVDNTVQARLDRPLAQFTAPVDADHKETKVQQDGAPSGPVVEYSPPSPPGVAACLPRHSSLKSEASLEFVVSEPVAGDGRGPVDPVPFVVVGRQNDRASVPPSRLMQWRGVAPTPPRQ